MVVEPLDSVEDAGRPVDAEAALTWPHSQPQRPPDVVEISGAPPLHCLLESLPCDQLALANDLLGLGNGFARAEPRAEHVEASVLRVGQRLLVRPARALDPELCASGVHRRLGHEAERRRLAARDRHNALDAIAVAVVQQRVGTAHLARVGYLLLREKWARPGPNTERAGLAEAGDELLSLVEHLVDLGLGDLELIGIRDPHVGRA